MLLCMCGADLFFTGRPERGGRIYGASTMTQAELNEAVSQATGENVSDIQQRGFSLVSAFLSDVFEESMPDPQTIDWDAPYVGATQSFYETC